MISFLNLVDEHSFACYGKKERTDIMFDKIKKDMVEAMKAKNSKRLAVLRMIKASVDQVRIDKKWEITDDVVMDVLLKQVKMREDSIDSYQKAGRSDLVEKEQEEVDIIREYLPKPLTEEEIDKIIDETIAEIKPTGMSDMGKIMGIVSPKVKGKCDMKEVSSKIRERLQ